MRIIKACDLKHSEKVHLLSLRTIDGDTLYSRFRHIITGAFLDDSKNSHQFFGDIKLSKCISNSLVFSLDYGYPYIKGCVVTGWENGFKGENDPKGFCFAEKDLPESIWFGDKNTLIVIKNEISALDGKYTVYDSARKSGERSYHLDTLPSKEGYKIFSLK
ncbi:hypothetical protein [Serratia aquatilis]|uniref:Uncharacterized protein n=1 Tax=Serratia aquatilis TaxID=1737515 RepID=A0ABV6EDA1_9GAMM